MVDGPNVKKIVQEGNPFTASELADKQAQQEAPKDPARLEYFSNREVLTSDGKYPFGEGFLYARPQATNAHAGIAPGTGKPGAVGQADNKGKKEVQQDALGGLRLKIGDDEAAVLVVADGVSASGPLADRASQTAVKVFLGQLKTELGDAPTDQEKRHLFVEAAMTKAAVAANFEVARQVLLDLDQNGAYDAHDEAVLEKAGIELPKRPLTVEDMQQLGPTLDGVVQYLAKNGTTAQTTFAAAVAVDNDLYTFTSGDSVISLFRPSRPQDGKLIQITERDQAVVELFKMSNDQFRNYPELFQNVITDSFGDSGVLSGTIRRYPDILQPGDRVVASTDGLGPRGKGGARGLKRRQIEDILARAKSASDAAKQLVAGQVGDVAADEYQDNVAVVVLEVK